MPARYTRTPHQMERLNNAVVALVRPVDPLQDEGEHDSYCSGSFIAEDYVLTAAHCVDDRPYVRIGTYADYLDTRGTFEDYHWTFMTVTKVDVDADLALLHKEDDGLPLAQHSYLIVSAQPPTQGENVILLGQPRGLAWTLSAGVVSSDYRHGWDVEYEGNPPLFIQHDAQSAPGSSGGPLMNYRDEVVGVLVEGMGEYLSMSVHTNVINRFLRRGTDES